MRIKGEKGKKRKHERRARSVNSAVKMIDPHLMIVFCFVFCLCDSLFFSVFLLLLGLLLLLPQLANLLHTITRRAGELLGPLGEELRVLRWLGALALHNPVRLLPAGEGRDCSTLGQCGHLNGCQGVVQLSEGLSTLGNGKVLEHFVALIVAHEETEEIHLAEDLSATEHHVSFCVCVCVCFLFFSISFFGRDTNAITIIEAKRTLSIPDKLKHARHVI
jgi:hypothetical protein